MGGLIDLFWNAVVPILAGVTVPAVFLLAVFIGFCVILNLPKLRASSKTSMVIRSIDERVGAATPSHYLAADAPRGPDGRYPTDAAPDDLVVHQQDVQSVLNALWAGGAEAIAMQDQRIVATSAPRCIGNTLLLHGRTYSPPYVITALGDRARLEAALAAEPGINVYKQYAARFGLGYTQQASDDLTVPAYTGSATVR